jgi:hypothetical protein
MKPTLTKKGVVQAINFAITILMAIFIGMALQAAMFVNDQTGHAFLIFTAQSMAMVALYVLLQFVLKTIFGKNILTPECPDFESKMRILYLWARGECNMSPPNQLVLQKEIYQKLTAKIKQYL